MNITRLIVVVVVSGLFVGCTVEDRSVVRAGGEQLRGVVLDESSGLTVFRGVPFAAPPTGERRWKPPAPHVPRAGIQVADTFAPACPQQQGNHDWYRNVAELFGNPPETIGPLENIDEDCLYLNVWSNNLGGEEKLPVMVWIHGGSNRNGYSSEPNYLGTNLAARGVVVVSVAYRVGAMGFLGHPGLAAESPQGITGNYAILDHVAALKWVQQNIAAFGGDPQSVTVFGESSGAANTATLAASPLAKGLFQRGISQSGGYQLGVTATQGDIEAAGVAVASNLGIDASTDAKDAVARLRELDWETIVDAARGPGVARYTTAVKDGYVLPDLAGRRYKNGEHNGIDWLIGANANEGYMYLPEPFETAHLMATIENMGEPWSDDTLALLADDIAADYRLAADRLSGARQFLCSSRYLADAAAASGAATWFYYFTRVRPGGDKILAYHGAEIPYALDTADDWLPADDVDHRLTDVMAQYWVNFATTGSPNGPDLPEWPRYTASGGEYMELGDVVQAGNKLEAELCGIMNGRLETILEPAQVQ